MGRRDCDAIGGLLGAVYDVCEGFAGRGFDYGKLGDGGRVVGGAIVEIDRAGDNLPTAFQFAGMVEY